MDKPLVHCVYASAATRAFPPESLQALLAKAQANNRSVGVTGILLHADGNFFQVLEGEAEPVDALYDRIALDPRHARITRVIREPILARSFSEWSMGYAKVTRKDLAKVPGLNGFFADQQRFLSSVDPGRARQLLSAFAEGRWRSNVQTDLEVVRRGAT